VGIHAAEEATHSREMLDYRHSANLLTAFVPHRIT
jgi:hypothetical protein